DHQDAVVLPLEILLDDDVWLVVGGPVVRRRDLLLRGERQRDSLALIAIARLDHPGCLETAQGGDGFLPTPGDRAARDRDEGLVEQPLVAILVAGDVPGEC